MLRSLALDPGDELLVTSHAYAAARGMAASSPSAAASCFVKSRRARWRVILLLAILAVAVGILALATGIVPLAAGAILGARRAAWAT